MTQPLTPEAQSYIDDLCRAYWRQTAKLLRSIADQAKTYQIHSPDNRDPWTDEITAITADDILTIADELDHAI